LRGAGAVLAAGAGKSARRAARARGDRVRIASS
jgi:hypothetical protein